MAKRSFVPVRSKLTQFILVGVVASSMVLANTIVVLRLHNARLTNTVSSEKTSELSEQKKPQQKDSQPITPSEDSTASDSSRDNSNTPTSQPSTAPKAMQPATAPSPPPPYQPRPFGIAGATLSQAYACQSSPSTAYFNIGDVNISFSAPTGGTLTYRLESVGLEDIGSLGLSHTVSVPNGTWSSTLNKLSSASGPHQLYTGSVDLNGGGEASVWVVVQAGGGVWTSAPISIPGTTSC